MVNGYVLFNTESKQYLNRSKEVPLPQKAAWYKTLRGAIKAGSIANLCLPTSVVSVQEVSAAGEVLNTFSAPADYLKMQSKQKRK